MACRLSRLKDSALFFLNNYGDRSVVEWYFSHATRLERFRNIHAGEDCFIIGNGPSLRRMDLPLLSHHHTFGLNKIHLLLEKVNIDLSYHVSVNPLVIEQSVREFEKLPCPSFLAYRAAAPHSRGNGRSYYLATDAPCSFYKDITRPIYEGFTVTYVALQIAYFMGFRRVFLIGVDHSFTATGPPNEAGYLQGEDPNHFDSRYFSNNLWHYPDLEGSELSYSLARFFYARDGRQIYDATVDGKLQIFPKIPYDKALSMCSEKKVS